MIGLSAVLVMLFLGRIAGISGITWGAMTGPLSERGWRAAFLLGLLAAPLLVLALTGTAPEQTVPSSMPGMIVAGLLVGFGARLGSGCTSGHGVCGLARLSPRSLVAVLTFMATAILTVFVLRHLP
ncbi:hypothetical protein LX81_00630 [Palleronia aestuarii]|uniref:Uncharacterized protein n=2 Tax=Palleronia aestuarii TaxID=568105 RepID=A0A2W7P0E4_9RHOB|nr:hypothetical protein LX81_00630 [Palleronia aestuarii]